MRNESVFKMASDELPQVGMLLQGCADPSNHDCHVAALQMLESARREVSNFGCFLVLVRFTEHN